MLAVEMAVFHVDPPPPVPSTSPQKDQPFLAGCNGATEIQLGPAKKTTANRNNAKGPNGHKCGVAKNAVTMQWQKDHPSLKWEAHGQRTFETETLKRLPLRKKNSM